MSIGRACVRTVNSFVSLVVLIAVVCAGAYSAYALWDNNQVYEGARNVQIQMQELKPDIEDPENGPTFDELLKINPDVCAWITMDGTHIDFPVLQGETNLSYINTDVYGDFALAGSIFLDAHNAPDFSDPYSLIYGHHMEHGLMFGTLDSFLDKDYFDSHREGTLVVINGVSYRLELFAAMETDASVRSIFDPAWQEDPLPYIREHAAIWYEPEGDCLIGMSTCKSLETTERIVVFGVLHEDEQ